MKNSKERVIFSKVEMVLGGYQAGFKLVNGMQPDAVEYFTVISSRGAPRMLLPPAQPLMRSAMANFLSVQLLAYIVSPCVQMASRVGGLFSRYSTNVSLMSETGKPSPLRLLISSAIGRNDFQIALRVSFGRPNGKTVAMAISDTGEILCYVKLGSEVMTSDLVAHESAILGQFEDSEMPVILPRLLFSGTWADGQSVLITAPLELKRLKRDASLAHMGADALASLNGLKGSTLIDSVYWSRTVERINEFGNSSNLQSTVAEIERIWGATEFDFGICHGDWTRANLGISNGRLAALDWERCNDFSPRGIDIAHFAICENPWYGLTKSKTINIDRMVIKVRTYLSVAGIPAKQAEVLILFALLEMVLRFKSAKIAGVQSTDLKFEPALQEGLRQWSS